MRTNDVECAAEDIAVPVADGEIRGTLRTPSEGIPRAVIVVHPATAVPERMYAGFASFLAEHGYAVVTYDYRGTGRSGAPRQHRSIRMRDWINEDAPAVADWAAARFAHLPSLAIGHSIGGHALALGADRNRSLGTVLIASHAGVTSVIEQRGERAKVRFVLSVAGPVLSRSLGYMPGRRMGLGEDIPAGAMLEWSRWSRLPSYFFDDPSMRAAERAAQITGPVLTIGLTDDPWATPKQMRVISRALANADVEQRLWSPADGGVAAIGHMGFFRRALRETLWPELVAWLRAREVTDTTVQ